MAKTKGFSGIRPGAIKEFTPDMYIEEGKEKTGAEPVFSLTYPSISEKQSIYDRFYEGNRIAKGQTGACFEAVIRPHVKGMRNVPAAFEMDDQKHLVSAVYDMFDFDLRGALFSEIMTGGEPTDEETNGVKL